MSDSPSSPVNAVGLAILQPNPDRDLIRDGPRFEDPLGRQAAYEEEQARLAEQQGPRLP